MYLENKLVGRVSESWWEGRQPNNHPTPDDVHHDLDDYLDNDLDDDDSVDDDKY